MALKFTYSSKLLSCKTGSRKNLSGSAQSHLLLECWQEDQSLPPKHCGIIVVPPMQIKWHRIEDGTVVEGWNRVAAGQGKGRSALGRGRFGGISTCQILSFLPRPEPLFYADLQ